MPDIYIWFVGLLTLLSIVAGAARDEMKSDRALRLITVLSDAILPTVGLLHLDRVSFWIVLPLMVFGITYLLMHWKLKAATAPIIPTEAKPS